MLNSKSCSTEQRIYKKDKSSKFSKWCWGNNEGIVYSQEGFLMYLYYWSWAPIVYQDGVSYIVESVSVLILLDTLMGGMPTLPRFIFIILWTENSLYQFFNDDSRDFTFWMVSNCCAIQRDDPLQILQIKIRTKRYTCREIGLAPGWNLLPQLPFTESESLSYCTVEVAGGICIKIKRGPLFDEIKYFSHSWYWYSSRKGTPKSTKPPIVLRLRYCENFAIYL